MVTGYRPADQWIVLGNNRPLDGAYAVQFSADPKYLVAQSWDETIAVSLYTKWGPRISHCRPPRK
ncbi:MAG: hypothetical protein K0S78_5123 [Thermomicrobiales bacterium]|jgi:hypothetical protein|nr:hypothetical protein [Thermomicrobiales bacterium]